MWLNRRTALFVVVHEDRADEANHGGLKGKDADDIVPMFDFAILQLFIHTGSGLDLEAGEAFPFASDDCRASL